MMPSLAASSRTPPCPPRSAAATLGSRADDRLGRRRGRDHRPDRAAGARTVAPTVHCGRAGRRDRAARGAGRARRSAWPARWGWRSPPRQLRRRSGAALDAAVRRRRDRPADGGEPGPRRATWPPRRCPRGRRRAGRRRWRYGTRRSWPARRWPSRGADLVTELCGPAPRLLTHCNTGALATVTGGTALARRGRAAPPGGAGGVIASETRPLLQGARLTAWELGRLGIPYRVAVDGAGPFLMARGEVDAVILGADRICANGDVVNKVGSYAHALGARAAGHPVHRAWRRSHCGPWHPDRRRRRDRGPGRRPRCSASADRRRTGGAAAVNPAFDVTPHHLVTAIVTDGAHPWRGSDRRWLARRWLAPDARYTGRSG